MYCPKCGTQNDDNNFKCTNCGTIIQQIPSTNANAPVMASSNVGIFIAVIAGIMFFIAIIGILAAIAIPQFHAYRTRSYNAAAQADLRNAATTEAAFYVDNSKYTDSIEKLKNMYGLFISQGVTMQIIKANEDVFTITAFHENGDKTYSITGPGGLITSYPKEKYLK
jgi:type IV pilus assembly protein PilA